MSIADELKQNKLLADYDGEDRVECAKDILKAIKQKPEKLPKPSKMPLVDHFLRGGFYPGQLVVISGTTGHGKCHGKGQEILMFDGSIKKVEDIKAGDLLMGDDSQARIVLSTTSGMGDLYRITGKGGVSYTANSEHILCLKRTGTNSYRYIEGKGKEKFPRRNRKGEIREITVSSFIESAKTFKNVWQGYKVSVDFAWIREALKIEPYYLGLWIGDGHSSSASITTADVEVVEYIYDYADRLGLKVRVTDQGDNLSKVYSVTKHTRGNGFSIQKCLSEYNLKNNKHIPLDYKTASKDDRLELLAGIIDSDGYVNKPNGYELCIKSKLVADDVVFVARSLGLASYHIKPKVVKGTIYYRVTITGNTTIIPVRIPRKKVGCRNQIKDASVYGLTVTPIGCGEYYGFEITGNGRYLLGDFTVTHNTTLAQTWTMNLLESMERPLWFSYEVTHEDFLRTFADIDKGYLDHIFMPASMGKHHLKWIEERIKESFLKYQTSVVFIDHLHYLVEMNGKQNLSTQVGETMRGLKQLALRTDMVIFLICHTMKTKGDEELDLGSVRDSSFVEQEADTVFYIWRDQNDESKNILKLAKNRKGGVIGKRISLRYERGRYFEESFRDNQAEDSGTDSRYPGRMGGRTTKRASYGLNGR